MLQRNCKCAANGRHFLKPFKAVVGRAGVRDVYCEGTFFLYWVALKLPGHNGEDIPCWAVGRVPGSDDLSSLLLYSPSVAKSPPYIKPHSEWFAFNERISGWSRLQIKTQCIDWRSNVPTRTPTPAPTLSRAPTAAPTHATLAPSVPPTDVPTAAPSASPTFSTRCRTQQSYIQERCATVLLSICIKSAEGGTQKRQQCLDCVGNAQKLVGYIAGCPCSPFAAAFGDMVCGAPPPALAGQPSPGPSPGGRLRATHSRLHDAHHHQQHERRR